MKIKDIIFISHSTHEDDYPAAWLASKLKRLGYNVFIDLDDLTAGNTFWTVLQPKIQNETFKFITINTKSYVKKSSIANTGVRRELNAASTIKNDDNFFIPVIFDDVNRDTFPMEYLGRKDIVFTNRWGEGLNELVKDLEEYKTPKNNEDTNPLKIWHKALRVKNEVINNNETIFSNWFPISLPKYIYIYKPTDFDKKKLVNIPTTTILEANHVICFASPETFKENVIFEFYRKILTADFINNEGIIISDDFTIVKPIDKLKNIVNKIFKSNCKRKGLKAYKQSGEKEIFYFPFINNKPKQYSLKIYNKSRVALVGNRWSKNWHLAVDAKVDFHPEPHYKIFYHIIFTNENTAFLEAKEQQIYRKKFGQLLYNKKSFELLLGAM